MATICPRCKQLAIGPALRRGDCTRCGEPLPRAPRREGEPLVDLRAPAWLQPLRRMSERREREA